VNNDLERHARAMLHDAASRTTLPPDPYARLMRRIRRRRRARTTTVCGIAAVGVAATATVVPWQLSRHSETNHNVANQEAPAPALHSAVSPAPAGSLPLVSATPTPEAPPPEATTVAGAVTTQADAVRDFLETDADFAHAALLGGYPGTSSSGRWYCGVTILGHSADNAELYAYFTCVRFVDENGLLHMASGTDAPVLLHVEGAGPDTRVTSWELPRDGNLFSPDIKKMFPPAIADRALRRPPGTVPAEAPLRARAQADLDRGAL
jgi:hypothetical protein